MIITRVWFKDDRIYVLTNDGETVWQSLLWYKRLRNASNDDRNNYEIDDEGIHWYELDEDISFESFGYSDPEPVGVSKLFLTHPELNPSAVAKRIGISPFLMTQFVNGTRKPSKECESKIFNEIRIIAENLLAVK